MDDATQSWGEKTLSGMVAACALLFLTIAFETMHAALNGWVHLSHLISPRLFLGAVFAVLIWLLFYTPLIAIANFKRKPVEEYASLKHAAPAALIGALAGYAVWFVADYLHFIVTVPFEFLAEDFAGAAIATAFGWFLTAVVLFRKRSVEKWAVVGMTVGIAWATLTKELPAYVPLVTINGVAVCLAPAVVLLERLTRFSKRVCVAVLVVVSVIGAIGIGTWSVQRAPHTTLTDESVGLGAFEIGDRLGLFDAPDFSLCRYEKPSNVRFRKEPTRNIFLVTIDALRVDHTTKERFPTLFSDDFIEIPNGYSVGTKTDDSLDTLFTGRLLDSEPGPMIATTLRAQGYNIVAAAALVEEGEAAKFGFEKNVGPEYLAVLREEVDAKVAVDAEKAFAETPDPMFGWVHFVAPHRPHRPSYAEEVDLVAQSVEAVLQSIKKRDPNAIVIVSADHGEALGDFGLQTHVWQAWQSVVRVPLFVSGFKPAEPNRMTSLLDITPTWLDLIGAEHTGFQGCSMLRKRCQRALFLQGGTGPYLLRGLILDDTKLIYDFARRSYRMTTLDDESKNLIDENPDHFQELRNKLSCHEQPDPFYPPRAN